METPTPSLQTDSGLLHGGHRNRALVGVTLLNDKQERLSTVGKHACAHTDLQRTHIFRTKVVTARHPRKERETPAGLDPLLARSEMRYKEMVESCLANRVLLHVMGHREPPGSITEVHREMPVYSNRSRSEGTQD